MAHETLGFLGQLQAGKRNHNPCVPSSNLGFATKFPDEYQWLRRSRPSKEGRFLRIHAAIHAPVFPQNGQRPEQW